MMLLPPAQDHEMLDDDDDDGMPPLVDNPLPPMTFTFSANAPPPLLSPYTYTHEFTVSPSAHMGMGMSMGMDVGAGIGMGADAGMDTGTIGTGAGQDHEEDSQPPRGSHAKKRDASYIPRPPNAFILFRSSFIRGGHIPGQIEGNHSALSKIIGKCWKALPRHERKMWQEKAVVALAEHRKKYPDWRFKPAANALAKAKAKVKDGPPRKKRGAPGGPRKGNINADSKKKPKSNNDHDGGGGGGQAQAQLDSENEREREAIDDDDDDEERSREKRCAKIADLLVAGKTGRDLAAAVEEYDCETSARRGRRLKDEHASAVALHVQQQEMRMVRDEDVKVRAMKDASVSHTPVLSIMTDGLDVKPSGPHAARSAVDGRFRVPLTAMFKRSSSAPAARARTSAAMSTFIYAPAARRDSFSAVPVGHGKRKHDSTLCAGEDGGAETTHEEGTGYPPADSVSDSLSSIQTFCQNSPDLNVNDVHAGLDAFEFAAPNLPPFQHDGAKGLGSSSPVQCSSPVFASPSAWGHESEMGSPTNANISEIMLSTGEAYPAHARSPSSYSSLEGWAGSPSPPLHKSSFGPSPSSLQQGYVNDPDPATSAMMLKAFDAASYWPNSEEFRHGVIAGGPTHENYQMAAWEGGVETAAFEAYIPGSLGDY